MQALRGGAAVPAGGVPASKLKDYLERETPRIAKDAKHQQKPEVLNGLPADPEPAFGNALPIAAINVNIKFKPTRNGQILLEGPDGETIRQDPASSGPWQLHLEKGLHVLCDLDTHEEEIVRVRSLEGVMEIEF
jgi:hypothetical protein